MCEKNQKKMHINGFIKYWIFRDQDDEISLTTFFFVQGKGCRY